jgi:beta-lactamase regulating signal transducer with metallopeptidase domain
MTELLWQFTLSNLALSFVLALVAWAVQSTGKRPHVAHLLWLLVIAKLVTPPLLTVPVIPVPGIFGASTTQLAALAEQGNTTPLLAPALLGELGGVPTTSAPSQLTTGFAGTEAGKLLALLWLLGSVCILVWSLLRIVRFHRLLGMSCTDATPELQRMAAQLAGRMGLGTTPTVQTTSANFSPMVWWIGGRVRVLIPSALVDDLEAEQLRCIMAHELAHIRRRDHVVRWLEWLACVCFWWNPVAWWARRQLRANEEICCDALVLSSLAPNPHTYAHSLLSVVEFLASPSFRPPALASGIDSGGFLQRRFTMIVSGRVAPKANAAWRAFALVCAVGLLPLGVAYAQDDSSDSAIQGLAELVKTGELSVEDARHIFNSMSPVDWVSKRYAPTAAEIDAAVAGGRMTAEEGAKKKEAHISMLQSMAFYIEVLGASSGEAKKRVDMEAGKLTREQAGERAHKSELSEPFEWMYEHLSKSGVPREQMDAVMGGIKKVMHEMKSEGERYELHPELNQHFISMGLSDQQIKLVQELASRALQQPATEGEEHMRWMLEHLKKGGLQREQMKNVVGVIQKIAHQMRSEGERFQLDPGMREYLVSLGISEKQITLVRELAAHTSRRPAEDEGIEHHFNQLGISKKSMAVIMERLKLGGVSKEQFEPVLGGMLRVVLEMQSEGDQFQLGPRTLEHFLSSGLSAGQIDLIKELSRNALSDTRTAAAASAHPSRERKSKEKHERSRER